MENFTEGRNHPPKTFKRYTITSALPYANGPLHIGHLAGVYIPADIYARYLRMKGRDVIFIGGSDEHGVPITIKARQQGVTPQEIVDKYHEMIKSSFALLGISFDIYSRTSLPVHHQIASDFFLTLYNKGEFIEKTSQQYFDEAAQQFLADRYITGTCPYCSYDQAYGDQCEKCGTSLNATDLINPKSVLSGQKPVLKETNHWFLPLDKYQPWLSEWILEGHKDDWKPNVYGQCKSWIEQGLQPRAVTRDLDWGVKVPLPDTERKVLYVWFDAPIGYISATKDWAEQGLERGNPADKEKYLNWERYWKDPETKLVHFIGKDNIVFHCIIFPAMLKAEGSYILPENVPAFEFMNLENDKISTSRNWAVWLHEYLKDFSGKQDVLRYVLTANAPETKDNDFTWKDFQTRNNSELLAIFGNFVNRTMVLVQKFYGGKVPSPGSFSDLDTKTWGQIKDFADLIGESLEQYRFREALNNLMDLARMGNKYLTESEPWKLIKTDEERVKTIMYVSLQICANLAVLSEPFLPFTAEKIRKMLGLPQYYWDDARRNDLLPAGQVLGEPALLFEKIEDAAIQHEVEKLLATKETNKTNTLTLKPQKGMISLNDFSAVDIRCGTILEAEKVPKTQKLLKLKIDTGLDVRTVVSGIAEYFNPEEIIGRRVSILANLEPVTIRGIESKGMILMAENSDGKLFFVSPDDGTLSGADIK